MQSLYTYWIIVKVLIQLLYTYSIIAKILIELFLQKLTLFRSIKKVLNYVAQQNLQIFENSKIVCPKVQMY